MPEAHRAFLEQALPLLKGESFVTGIAAAGSYVSPGLDEHSDLDLIIVVSAPDLPTDAPRRVEIAGKLGDLIACFTGEHVGEPRLLICLYDPWLLHVDLKFTTLEGFQGRVEDPAILYDPTGKLAESIQTFPGSYPPVDLQWAEDRIWIWIHYAATKFRRGELLTAKQTANYILERILGPMILARAGAQPNQVRRIEQVNPLELSELQMISSCSDRASVKDALSRVAKIYVSLRAESDQDVVGNDRAESATRTFLKDS